MTYLFDPRLKKCFKCKAEKSIFEFSKDAQKSDGLSSRCRECNKTYKKLLASSQIKTSKNYSKAWRQKNKEKVAAHSQKWRDKNKEKIRESDRIKAAIKRKTKPEIVAKQKHDYYVRNKEKILQKDAAYRSANPEVQREYIRRNRDRVLALAMKYRAENVDRFRAYRSNRRAREMHSGKGIKPEDIAMLMTKQKRKCACCKTNIKQLFHVDHIKPLARGGRHEKENIQLLCPPCNLSKGAKDPIDFMQLRGFLL